MVFYAVARGKVPGVYSTWAECEQQVKGVSCSHCKRFQTLAEAESYVDEYRHAYALPSLAVVEQRDSPPLQFNPTSVLGSAVDSVLACACVPAGISTCCSPGSSHSKGGKNCKNALPGACTLGCLPVSTHHTAPLFGSAVTNLCSSPSFSPCSPVRLVCVGSGFTPPVVSTRYNPRPLTSTPLVSCNGRSVRPPISEFHSSSPLVSRKRRFNVDISIPGKKMRRVSVVAPHPGGLGDLGAIPPQSLVRDRMDGSDRKSGVHGANFVPEKPYFGPQLSDF